MDIEEVLLGKAIQAGEYHEIVRRGIEPDHFADPDCAEVAEFCSQFLRQHRQSPSANVVKSEYPDFSIKISKDPLSWHIERFINKVRERMAIDLVRDYMDIMEDPDEIPQIETHAFEMARMLSEVVPAPRATRFSDKQRKDEYDRRLQTGQMRGIYIGVPSIDKEILGVQPHQLVTLVAYVNTGKTTGMQHMAYSFYLQGKTSLIISLEQDAEEIMRKIDVMASNVKYHALKALELDVKGREQWERILERAHEDRHERDIVVVDNIARCTVDRVGTETMRYKPDAVFVDYLELMATPKGISSQHWEKVSFCGAGLKENARVLGIPHVTAAQLDRTGGKGEIGLHNIGYQSVGKHSDIVFGLRQDEDSEAKHEMEWILLKHRDGHRNITAELRWELDRGFIKEKGVEERFPEKNGHKPDRLKQQRLEIARAVGPRDGMNPFTAKAGKKANPFVVSARKKLAV